MKPELTCHGCRHAEDRVLIDSFGFSCRKDPPQVIPEVKTDDEGNAVTHLTSVFPHASYRCGQYRKHPLWRRICNFLKRFKYSKDDDD